MPSRHRLFTNPLRIGSRSTSYKNSHESFVRFWLWVHFKPCSAQLRTTMLYFACGLRGCSYRLLILQYLHQATRRSTSRHALSRTPTDLRPQGSVELTAIARDVGAVFVCFSLPKELCCNPLLFFLAFVFSFSKLFGIFWCGLCMNGLILLITLFSPRLVYISGNTTRGPVRVEQLLHTAICGTYSYTGPLIKCSHRALRDSIIALTFRAPGLLSSFLALSVSAAGVAS